MGSRSGKIYLLFWVGLLALTALGVWVLPKVLDSSQEQGYRELDPPSRRVSSVGGEVVTRFPVRAISRQEPLQRDRSFPRQALVSPGPLTEPHEDLSESGGLPQRQVVLPKEVSSTEAVTRRAQVVDDTPVYAKPKTTAAVLGMVKSGTEVRLLRTVDEAWDEILLRDGRQVYLAKGALTMSGAELTEEPSKREDTDGLSNSHLVELTATTEDFLLELRRGDVARARTYLEPMAPTLEEGDLGVWVPFVRAEVSARVERIEPDPEGGDLSRVVWVKAENNGASIRTIWHWERLEGRWRLFTWGAVPSQG